MSTVYLSDSDPATDTIPRYMKGQKVRLTAVFRDGDGLAEDPDNVTFKTRALVPDVAATYVCPTDAEVVKDSVGHYHLDVVATYSGGWAALATADNGAVAEIVFTVEESSFE